MGVLTFGGLWSTPGSVTLTGSVSAMEDVILGLEIVVTFTWEVADPNGDPRDIRFNATGSNPPSSSIILEWDFGTDYYGSSDLLIVYPFEEYIDYTVTLRMYNDLGELLGSDTQVVDLSASLVASTESDEEVYNLEVGHHAYEPVFTTGGLSILASDMLREHGTVNLAPAAVDNAIEYTVTDQQINISHIRVSGDGDALFEMLVDDVLIAAPRTIHHSQAGEDILDGAAIALTIGQVLKVRVTANQPTGSCDFYATAVGRVVS